MSNIPEEYYEAVKRLEKSHPVIMLETSTLELMCCVSAIQLALRHPGFKGTLADICREAVLKIQDNMRRVEPAIADVIEKGFDPTYDSEIEPPRRGDAEEGKIEPESLDDLERRHYIDPTASPLKNLAILIFVFALFACFAGPIFAQHGKPHTKIAHKRAVSRFYTPRRPIPLAEVKSLATYDYALTPAGVWVIPVSVYLPSRVSVEFSARDWQTDLDRSVTAHYGGGILQYNAPGAVEVIILDDWNYRQFLASRSYAAWWTSGLTAAGSGSVGLTPGWYDIVISNRASYLLGKRVKLGFKVETR